MSHSLTLVHLKNFQDDGLDVPHASGFARPTTLNYSVYMSSLIYVVFRPTLRVQTQAHTATDRTIAALPKRINDTFYECN